MDHGLIFLLTFLIAVGVWTAKAAKRDQAEDPLGRYPKRGKRFRRCLDQLRKVADAAGLTEVQAMETGLAGKGGEFKVHLKRRNPDQVSGTRIAISGLGQRWPGIYLQSSRIGVRLDREFETGDAAFDAKVRMHGNLPLARALLDSETRKAVGEVIAGRLHLDGGWELEVEAQVSLDTITIEVGRSLIRPETGGPPAEEGLAVNWARGARLADRKMPVTDDRLPEVIRAALAVARRLVVPPSLPVRIAENLRSEAHGEVGIRFLRTLLERFPKDPATREALRVAAKEGSVEVRLRAAIALGEEGQETLITLALEQDTGDVFRARAVKELGAHLPREAAEGVYASALANGERRAAAASLAALGRIGGEEAVAALGRALGEAGGELAAAAASALGETRLPSAEAPLLAKLESLPIRGAGRGWLGRTTTLACSEALGRVGSARAVPTLRECAARRPDDRELRSAVRQAVGQIQSRLQGAEPGQLSLAAVGAGELSVVADDASGRLTVTRGGASGRVSFSGDASGRPTVSPEDAGDLAPPEEGRREPLPHARSRQLEGPNAS